MELYTLVNMDIMYDGAQRQLDTSGWNTLVILTLHTPGMHAYQRVTN